jgi:hypothetical protein
MPVSRATAWRIETNRGHSVWGVLCRTALRGADLAAKLFGLDENAEQGERAELLFSYGVAPVPPRNTARTIDWANLSDFERGRVAREMNAATPVRASSFARRPPPSATSRTKGRSSTATIRRRRASCEP